VKATAPSCGSESQTMRRPAFCFSENQTIFAHELLHLKMAYMRPVYAISVASFVLLAAQIQ
jgi:hypothetical protein